MEARGSEFKHQLWAYALYVINPQLSHPDSEHMMLPLAVDTKEYPLRATKCHVPCSLLEDSGRCCYHL